MSFIFMPCRELPLLEADSISLCFRGLALTQLDRFEEAEKVGRTTDLQ